MVAPIVLALAAGVRAERPGIFYYYYDQPQALELSLQHVAVPVADGAQAASVSAALRDRGLVRAEDIPWDRPHWVFARLPAAAASEAQLREVGRNLVRDGVAEFVSPVLFDQYGPLVIKPALAVGFRRDLEPARAEAILRASEAGEIVDRNWGGMPLTYRLRAAAAHGLDVLAAANRLAEHPDVLWAEPGRVISVALADVIPNDPLFGSQWALHNTGQSGGIVDLDMDLPEAWDLEDGDTSQVVVVLDSGIQQNHPDINQITGHDFTGAGVYGGGPGNECDNHGTGVGGVVTAIMNNGIGLAGVCPGCLVTSAKVVISNVPCDGGATGDPDDIVDALQWADNLNYSITNSSLAFQPISAIAQKYIDTRAAGLVHFAATGNEGVGEIAFPASVWAVHGVTGIDRFGIHHGNFGSGVGFTAPSVDIVTADRTGNDGYVAGDYATIGGTSIASPLAAGVAALLRSVREISPADVDYYLQITATDLGLSGYDTMWGWGLVNAHGAALSSLIEVCGSNLGSCYEVNLVEEGCNDSTCCWRVCDEDPYCCYTAWDELCVEAAFELCAGCGEPDAGSCFAAHTYGACDDAECCAIVCGLDPSCCETSWDAACVTLAVVNCAPPNDDCVDAVPISAVGAHAFFNNAATTDGYDHQECEYAGQSGIERDVWFRFTAPSSGEVEISTCGQTLVDTKLAVYVVAACPPTDLDLLDCNDDACGYQSTVSFTATAGQAYLIRVGVYPGQSGGQGTFTVAYPAMGSDSCQGATSIGGLGAFTFDNSAATMDGEDHPECYWAGTSAIDHDVWYCWTAPETGTAVIETCDQTGVDTKIAAYASCGTCPPVPELMLACNDDACGLQSRIEFEVTEGWPYRLRIGTYPEASGGTGTFTITIGGSPVCPWDCGDGNGVVDVADFLALLAQWGQVGTSCDFDGGGVSVADFLAFLAHFGACP